MIDRSWAGLVVAPLLAGCAFFVQGPPDNYRPERHGAPACNSSVASKVTLDAIGAAWGIALTAIAVDGWSEGNDDARGYVLVGAVGTAIHVVAIAVGVSRTVRCRDAQDEFIGWADLRGRPLPDFDTFTPPPTVVTRPLAPPRLAPPPRSCEELRRALDAETDPPRRFELIREIHARCGTAPPGQTAPAGEAAPPPR